jgi:GxxExxY protein
MGGMHTDDCHLDALSGVIIGCAFTVMNTLGVGFLEKIYENALALEPRQAGVAVDQQARLTVHYAGTQAGEYFPDLLIVELKTVQALDPVHRMQCVNYLKASGLKRALLLNFGRPRLEIRRILNDA